MKKYLIPTLMFIIFETVAITLWLTKDNFFYLLNFSYIGCSIALGLILYIKGYGTDCILCFECTKACPKKAL